MRQFFTTEALRALGMSRSAARAAVKRGRLTFVVRGVHADGPEDPTELDRAISETLAADGIASGRLTGVLLGLDSVQLRGPDFTLPPGSSNHRRGARRRTIPEHRTVTIGQVRSVDALQGLVDLAAELDDLEWEQALESALRMRLVTIEAIHAEAEGSFPGVARMRRVLALRPAGAPPTESLLETLFLQLVRTVPALPPPVRQYVVTDRHGRFVARVDFAWPELGLFIELDARDTPANRSTTPVGRRQSSPPLAGCVAGSPGPRSGASRTAPLAM